MSRFSKHWTPELKAELAASVNHQSRVQIEDDPELKELADWMCSVCGVEPSSAIYRLILLSTAISVINQ